MCFNLEAASVKRILIVSGKLNNRRCLRSPARRGQGVVEYAGAIVIAAVLVSLAVFVVPTEVAGLVNSIMNTAINFFMSYLPSA